MDSGPDSPFLTDSSNQKVNILVSLSGLKTAEAILPCLISNPHLNIRVLKNEEQWGMSEHHQLCMRPDVYNERRMSSWEDGYTRVVQRAEDHARWADVLFVAAHADAISAMLAGLGHDTALAVLRCWDVSKQIVMLPEMSTAQWRSPITKRQLIEIRNNWQWIYILGPALWDIKADRQGISDQVSECNWDWQGGQEALRVIQREVETIYQADYCAPTTTLEFPLPLRNKRSAAKHLHRPRRPAACPTSKLPGEIWTIIFEFLGDWEYAVALGIYTTVPVPCEWQTHIPSSPTDSPSLEYTLLTASYPAIYKALNSHSSTPSALSSLAVKIIFKFSLTSVLSHLATHQKDIFWTSFGLPQIPHQASTVYNNPSILEWWRTEPAILKKEYGPEAMDGASRAGFVDVLDWWADSGLEVRYTEKALENASAKGQVEVLEWWRKTSNAREPSSSSTTTHPNSNHSGNLQPLPLKVGKSIISAAQCGQTSSIRWWHHSTIPYPHEESVARIASTHGHVDVLETWRELKGSKMIFDNQVLVGATKNGHADVLEWWKSRSGGAKGGGGGGGEMRVEYKTCDIEEAMEDCLGGSAREREVRQWWQGNGLNLGVGTGEWMKVKTLGSG